MSKFADIAKGRKARKTVPFPGIIAPAEDAPEVVLDLVVLSGSELADVLANARAFAKGKGVDAPKPAEPEYDLGLMVYTLLVACKDHSSPAEAPTPFFASAAEILDNLDRERIAYLCTLQEIWQQELSPVGTKDLTEEKIWELVVQASEEEDPLRFFEQLPPATLGRCLHFTARRLLNVLRLKSASSSLLEASGASESRSEAS